MTHVEALLYEVTNALDESCTQYDFDNVLNDNEREDFIAKLETYIHHYFKI